MNFRVRSRAHWKFSNGVRESQKVNPQRGLPIVDTLVNGEQPRFDA